MKRTVKLVTLAALVVCAITLATMTLAQIVVADDDLVTHIADIADHPGYLVTDLEGYVAVFYKGRGYPVYITHTPVSTLREIDRKDVMRGILVETRLELIELLEDFGS